MLCLSPLPQHVPLLQLYISYYISYNNITRSLGKFLSSLGLSGCALAMCLTQGFYLGSCLLCNSSGYPGRIRVWGLCGSLTVRMPGITLGLLTERHTLIHWFIHRLKDQFLFHCPHPLGPRSAVTLPSPLQLPHRLPMFWVPHSLSPPPSPCLCLSHAPAAPQAGQDCHLSSASALIPRLLMQFLRHRCLIMLTHLCRDHLDSHIILEDILMALVISEIGSWEFP